MFRFQLSLIEFARNQCAITDASSQEFNPDDDNSLVKFMPEQEHALNLGGSMRLGKHDITIVPRTLADKIYQNNKIQRRHRHRYEFNQDYRQIMEKKEWYYQVIPIWVEELKFLKFLQTSSFLPSSIILNLTVYQEDQKKLLRRL